MSLDLFFFNIPLEVSEKEQCIDFNVLVWIDKVLLKEQIWIQEW